MAHQIKHTLLDANLEALQALACSDAGAAHSLSDKWTERALRNAAANYASLRHREQYQNLDRYKRAVTDLNRALVRQRKNGAVPGLTNYRDSSLSPAQSSDLIKAAERPEDNPYYPYFSERLSGLIARERPRLIGFSLNFLSQALCTFAMIGYVRKLYPGGKITLGGGLVTSWSRRSGWQNPFRGLVDSILPGPGEQQLLSVLGHNQPAKAHYLPSLEGLADNAYLSPGLILPYSAAQGCYWRKCSFCPEQAEGNPYAPVGTEQVIEDMGILVERYRPVLIHFLDNAMNTSLLKTLVKNPPGVPWYGFVRFSELLTNLDFCKALKQSGCTMLKLGLESGDQEVLDALNKGMQLHTAAAVLKTLKKAGIATYVYLLFGTPPETEQKARATLDFVVKHSEAISFLNVALFNMPLCSPGDSSMETRTFYGGDLTLYTDFRHPSGWDRRSVRKFLATEFRRHPRLSGILHRDPPLFRSNHAPFFCHA